MVEAIKGQSGWLTLQHLAIDSFDEDYLLFSALLVHHLEHPLQGRGLADGGMSKADLEKCHVLFQREDKATYIKKSLTRVVTP